MKELSIEEKAKRYDEALGRAKEIHTEERAQPFSQEGMLDKVIEVTAIQSEQISTLATIALYVTKSDKFVSDMAISMAMEHEERKDK